MCFCTETKKMRQKNDCKRVCLEKVFPQLYIWLLKNMTLGMCFHKNMGTRMCMRMQKTTMERERDCVSNSHHHRAWKRVRYFFVPPPD